MLRPTLCQWSLASLALAILFDSGSAAEPNKSRCVILISVDGLAGFYMDDPRADIPTIRKLAKNGARTQGMRVSFPSVTWPNHTTLVTGVSPGKHGVLGNNYFDRAKKEKVPLIIDPIFDKDEIVRVPTIYDVAHQAGLKTCGIVWPATRNAKTLDISVPDMAGEGWQRYGTGSWLSELRSAGIPVDRHGYWCANNGGVQRDWMYTRLLRHAIENHSPNLILIHLIEVDHVEHKHGPRTDDAYWSVSQADDRVRDIVEAVAAGSRADNTTIFVCSDHGFFPISRDIRVNVLLKQMGLLEAEGSKLTKQDAYCMSQGGGGAVYILDDARRAELSAKLREALTAVEGVERVYTPEEFQLIGQATPAQDQRAPDLWLTARREFSFSDDHAGTDVVAPRREPGGTHGYRTDQPDLLGFCVVSGAGVKPGAELGEIDNRDIAPTMAALLGVELPNVEGKALREMLAE